MLSLTASQLPRFMACNGFNLIGGIDPFKEDKTVTEEGNAAHWLIEQVFKEGREAEEFIDRKAPNGIYITGDMVDHVFKYANDLKNNKEVSIEVDTSYGNENYQIRGRADSFWWEDTTLVIADFKYGWRIVEPEENWTLISHAIGILSKARCNVGEISFKIYQPRPFHPEGTVREWKIDFIALKQLMNRLHHYLMNPADKCATSPECYKCPSISQCPAAQIATMNSIDVAYRAFDNEIDDDELSWMLDNIRRAQDVLKQSEDAYEDLALHRLKAGRIIKNYTAQSGLGKTKWLSGITADLIKALTGIDVSETSLISPAQAKILGVHEDIVKAYTTRPSTGFKLVRQDLNKKAEKLFGKKEK